MRISFYAMLLVGVACMLGCGGQKLPDGMPELFDFEVSVTQDGKPLADAVVVLRDAKGMLNYGVSGTTGSNGKTKLTTGEFPGAPAGEYEVIVTKDVETPSQYGNSIPTTDDAKAEWRANRAAEYRPTHCFVGEKFRDYKTSGLTVSISGAGNATLDVSPACDNIILPPDSAQEAPAGEAK